MFRRLFFTVILLSLLSLFFAASCGNTGDCLAFNKNDLFFTGEYEENGVTFVCAFSVTREDGGLVYRAEILAPEEASETVYTDWDGTRVVSNGSITYPLTSDPAPILRLKMCFPTYPVLCSVDFDGGERTEVFSADGGTYTFTYRESEKMPHYVTYSDGTVYRTLTITEFRQ